MCVLYIHKTYTILKLGLHILMHTQYIHTIHTHTKQTHAQFISTRDGEGVERVGEKAFCSRTKCSPEVERRGGGREKGDTGSKGARNALGKVVVHVFCCFIFAGSEVLSLEFFCSEVFAKAPFPPSCTEQILNRVQGLG